MALDRLPNGYDRALWMFLEDAQRFQYAEDVRYTDERRRGRMWDGFAGGAGLSLSDASEHLELLKQALREHFRSNNVHIEVFQRHRPMLTEGTCLLTQVTIYLEERADDVLEFHNGDLVRQPRRPVSEASLTYEAATGVIEVVARARENREQLARLLAQHLLAADIPRDRVPLRRFDLSMLRWPFDFPTDPEDGIESVRVNRLRLMPIGSVGERVTLECLRRSTHSLPEMAQHRFGTHDPLLGGWLITQAKLTIRFCPRGNGGGRSLPLTITLPNGCDLKDRTERERLIGEKYLRRWGVLQDV